ncbi:hypothetical protein LSH36_128g01021 [Paralvinella palmiformis]|uniref:C-type lectin domain-containing protein n=1 Tax=Paralvinella palmiformis TaxID=53620 RepID=A0AAD9JWN8_9ANNE|nr:hypothetical protein LSH36_128g01021 [Paralvinella palmiformis]
MESFDVFRSLMLAFCLGEIDVLSCPSDDHCHRHIFYELQNKTYDKQVLLELGQCPQQQCRRLCRQYVECFSFSMEWADDKFGKCTIYNGIINTNRLVKKDKLTLYVSCPRGFIWYGKANKCYSSQVFESVPGTVMIQVCKDLHPEATTVEPRNQAQMDVIVSIAVDRHVWVGMYRPENSDILEDFKYFSDGTNITYTNWGTGDPNNGDNNEDCVVSAWYLNFRLMDIYCYYTYLLICEV